MFQFSVEEHGFETAMNLEMHLNTKAHYEMLGTPLTEEMDYGEHVMIRNAWLNGAYTAEDFDGRIEAGDPAPWRYNDEATFLEISHDEREARAYSDSEYVEERLQAVAQEDNHHIRNCADAPVESDSDALRDELAEVLSIAKALGISPQAGIDNLNARWNAIRSMESEHDDDSECYDIAAG